MSDFLIALGLVFAIEGLVLAAFPVSAKRAMASVIETPENALRIFGIVSALTGVVLVWLVRG
ncbi:MAG TPA: DUF2065 domain-containing protein [Xanthobacteraceae bacterium]|jgi:hypothetical protein|nr:DUF2065 domain-containing protein [Xanthobacteraceae bacterium]